MCLLKFSSFGTQTASEVQSLNEVLGLARQEHTAIVFRIKRIHSDTDC